MNPFKGNVGDRVTNDLQRNKKVVVTCFTFNVDINSTSTCYLHVCVKISFALRRN